MLKHSNHTDKLCHGFPRPSHSGLMIHKKTHSQLWFITAEGYKAKEAKGKVHEAKSRGN